MSLQQYQSTSHTKKTFFVVTVVLVALVIIVFILVRAKKNTDRTENIHVAFVDSRIQGEYYRDSDNDGAYDWEEALWPELDPNNPDSDGDGVLDGDYIKQKKRNEILESQNREYTSDIPQSQQLGRSVYTALLALTENNSSNLGETEGQISDNVVQYIETLPLGNKTYLREDFNIVPTTYNDAQSYQKSMKSIFQKYQTTGDDIQLILSEIESPNLDSLELHTLNAEYHQYVEQLLAVSVPSLIAGRHTELTNSVNQFRATLENLTATETDDLVSLSFVVQLNDLVQKMDFAIQDIYTFFEFSNDPSLFQ